MGLFSSDGLFYHTKYIFAEVKLNWLLLIPANKRYQTLYHVQYLLIKFISHLAKANWTISSKGFLWSWVMSRIWLKVAEGGKKDGSLMPLDPTKVF